MKPFFVISCPIDTFSGYGARSRDLVKAIIETEKYDVKIYMFFLFDLQLASTKGTI